MPKIIVKRLPDNSNANKYKNRLEMKDEVFRAPKFTAFTSTQHKKWLFTFMIDDVEVFKKIKYFNEQLAIIGAYSEGIADDVEDFLNGKQFIELTKSFYNNPLVSKCTNTTKTKLNKPYFVKTENVSLKSIYTEEKNSIGEHYIKTQKSVFDDFREIIRSIIFSSYYHRAISPEDTSIKLFFTDEITFDRKKEFRLFVHKNKIVGISQQVWSETNDYLNSQTDEQLIKLANSINEYFEKNIREHYIKQEDYTIDIIIDSLEHPFYFIEINEYGIENNIGSSLFNWIDDRDKLYPKEDKDEIYFNIF